MAVAYPNAGADREENKVTQYSNSTGHAWFAVNTRSKYEDLVATQVRAKGYEVFLPVYTCRRRWSDRIKELELPLFPGYLFCRFDPLIRLPILTTPGVLNIVGIGKTPIPVDESEIAAIHNTVNGKLKSEPWPFLHTGQRVRVEFGPLSGSEGILLNFKGRKRLVLSISLLQRSIAVEVDGDCVKPVSLQSRPLPGSQISPAA